MSLTIVPASTPAEPLPRLVIVIRRRSSPHCSPAAFAVSVTPSVLRTSVLAWRRHDGLPLVSQDEILAYMGGSRSSGVSQERISLGVNNYTNTHDAFLDFADGQFSDPRGRFLSRQISSVRAGVPVIALARQGMHAIVIDGGTSHIDSTNGNQVWDTTDFMDPAIGPGTWLHGNLDQIDEICPNDYNTCKQVISRAASEATRKSAVSAIVAGARIAVSVHPTE